MLLEQLKKVNDPRSYHGKEYDLHRIVYFTILAILCNSKTYTDVARFMSCNFVELKKLFELKWRRAPDSSAIRKIIVALDPGEIKIIFQEDALDLAKSSSDGSDIVQQICFDGKSLRGNFSHTKNKSAIGVFSAFAAYKNIVLARIPLESDKGHEIKTMQDFFTKLPLKDIIVTADAVH